MLTRRKTQVEVPLVAFGLANVFPLIFTCPLIKGCEGHVGQWQASEG